MRLILTLFLVLLSQMAFPRSYVVCVGISDYPGRVNDLRVSANDAVTIQRIYERSPNTIVRCLTNSQATADRVMSTIRDLFSRAGTNDAIIFFFSGHGFPGSFACYDRLLRYGEVEKVMRMSKAHRKIVMADACFAGKMRSTKVKIHVPTENEVMFFLSSRTNETSKETGYNNSLFTVFLERGLRGGADANHDKTITAKEIFDFVHSGVVRASAGHQHPVMWGRFNKNMTIIHWR